MLVIITLFKIHRIIERFRLDICPNSFMTSAQGKDYMQLYKIMQGINSLCIQYTDRTQQIKHKAPLAMSMARRTCTNAEDI